MREHDLAARERSISRSAFARRPQSLAEEHEFESKRAPRVVLHVAGPVPPLRAEPLVRSVVVRERQLRRRRRTFVACDIAGAEHGAEIDFPADRLRTFAATLQQQRQRSRQPKRTRATRRFESHRQSSLSAAAGACRAMRNAGHSPASTEAPSAKASASTSNRIGRSKANNDHPNEPRLTTVAST